MRKNPREARGVRHCGVGGRDAGGFPLVYVTHSDSHLARLSYKSCLRLSPQPPNSWMGLGTLVYIVGIKDRVSPLILPRWDNGGV